MAKRWSTGRIILWLAIGLLSALAVGLRLVALDSDSYARLSWSTGLLTDEGFYIHNARNIVLFGTARTDGFNNMLIMPTLHLVQVTFFRIFGVGAVQARSISVVFSLLTLPVFFDGVRRIFGLRVALVGTLFLGLDHINLLYSRMALMDTPAAALLICSVYALIRGLPQSHGYRPAPGPVERRKRNSDLAWTFICGLLLGVTYATRGLTALIIPCCICAVWIGTRDLTAASRIGYVSALLLGLGVSLVIFVTYWYLPYHAEIAHVNRYYVGELLLPHTLSRLSFNVSQGLFDYQRGVMPYLMRHSPVQFGLACAGVGWAVITRAGRYSSAGQSANATLGRRGRVVLMLFVGWIITWCAFACCVNYAPSRYYVLFYPALAVLSAFTLFEAPRIAGEIVERKILLALLGSYMICLTAQAVRSRLDLVDVKGMTALFWGTAAAIFAGSQLKRATVRSARHRYAEDAHPPEIWISGLVLWLIVNSYWTGDWLLHLTYRQQAADRWLAVSLPANSTLIGAVAPGLCLNNHLKTVNVIANLCNDGAVVDQFPPPRYIVILDGGSWRERWWDERYPDLVAPARRIHTFRNVLRPFFKISVYSVDSPGWPQPSSH